MHRARTHLPIICIILWVSLAIPVSGQDKLKRVEEESRRSVQSFAWIPYTFYTDSFELALGAGAASYGYGQPQLSLVGTAFATTNNSWGVLGHAGNLRLRPLDRLFMDSMAGYIRYENKMSYVPGNPEFPDEPAGSNDSTKENFIETPARSGFGELRLRYLLPIGFARDTIINTFVIEDGLLVAGTTGGWAWNPMTSGRTYIELDFFYEEQELATDAGNQIYNTNGLRFQLEYNNTDFSVNPSHGSRQLVRLARDFGSGNSSGSWTTGEIDLAKYIDLGSGQRFRQRVLALGLWTSTAFSGSPPFYKGPRLGGMYRLRGYRQNRFHDQSAIYYSVELRVIPDWALLRYVDHLGPFQFSWWQFVTFAEVGRVSPVYSLSELHRDMKWNVGVGLRTLVKSILLRADLAFSKEGAYLSAMVGHAF